MTNPTRQALVLSALATLFLSFDDAVQAFMPSPSRVVVSFKNTPSTTLFGSVVDLTDSNFGDLLRGEADSNRLILVDCYAPWCGPCKLLEPVMEQVAGSYDADEEVLVCRYNVQGNDDDINTNNDFKLELALQGCMVRALPSLVVLGAHGKVVEHWEGLQSQDFIQKGLQKHLTAAVPEPIVAKPSAQKGLIGIGTWQQQEDDSYMLSNALI